MTRIETGIEAAFYNKKALVALLTAGDPTVEMTKKLVVTMEERGVDLIELGIPFSDPIAEGPAAKEANKRALQAGTTTDGIFSMVAELRQTVTVPIVLSTYLNPIFTYGVERFLKNCKRCGVDGIVVLDLPFEEKGELKEVCKQYGITIISMIVPAPKERIAMIAKEAAGFVYCIPGNNENDQMETVKQIKENSTVPYVIEVEKATKEQVRWATHHSDGVIVGSAIAELVNQYGENAVKIVGDYVEQLKQEMLDPAK